MAGASFSNDAPDRSDDGYGSLPREAGEVIEAEFVLPEEITRQWSGPQRLMFGILVDAIRVIEHGRVGRSAYVYDETLAWLAASDARDEWLFTFRNVCQTLGISESATRARVNDWLVIRGPARASGRRPSLMPHRLADSFSRTRVMSTRE